MMKAVHWCTQPFVLGIGDMLLLFFWDMHTHICFKRNIFSSTNNGSVEEDRFLRKNFNSRGSVLGCHISSIRQIISY